MLLLLVSVFQTKILSRALGAMLALLLSLGALTPVPAAAQSSFPGLSSLTGSSRSGDSVSSLAVGGRDVLVSRLLVRPPAADQFQP